MISHNISTSNEFMQAENFTIHELNEDILYSTSYQTQLELATGTTNDLQGNNQDSINDSISHNDQAISIVPGLHHFDILKLIGN